MSFVVRKEFFIRPVVISLAWSWFMSDCVLQEGKSVVVECIEFHGWFKFAQIFMKFARFYYLVS